MLTPVQITIDTSALPPAAQNAISNIDSFLASWTIGETEKLWTLTWASAGGWTAAKQAGLLRLLDAYEMLGWHVRPVVVNQTVFKAAFQW